MGTLRKDEKDLSISELLRKDEKVRQKLQKIKWVDGKWHGPKPPNAHVGDGYFGFWARLPKGTHVVTVLQVFLESARYDNAPEGERMEVTATFEGACARVDVVSLGEPDWNTLCEYPSDAERDAELFSVGSSK